MSFEAELFPPISPVRCTTTSELIEPPDDWDLAAKLSPSSTRRRLSTNDFFGDLGDFFASPAERVEGFRLGDFETLIFEDFSPMKLSICSFAGRRFPVPLCNEN